MWFCFRWLSRQYVWSLLSCNVLWRPELREPLNKDILLLQNSLCHLFSLSVKLAVQCQMVIQCRPYCCVVQLWLAGWAMGRWGLRGHEVHTPKKTQSLLQNLSKSQGVRDHGVTMAVASVTCFSNLQLVSASYMPTKRDLGRVWGV